MSRISKESFEIEKEGGEDESRQTWNNKVEYLLALIGNAVGIGNIWRFPYQCHKHGGGAFLIPYFIVLLLIGYPLLLMEIALGQKHRCGAVALWGQLTPYAAGIGICSFITAVFLTSYYAVVCSWSFVYAANSFTSPLPWSDCPSLENSTSNSSYLVEECASSSPTVYYWYRQTLNVPDSFEDSQGVVNWQIMLATLVSCILLFGGLQRGVNSTGKFMYFGILFPYLVLGTFLVRAFTLDGALNGISYLLKADMSKLADIKVWEAAITQIFFSIGMGYGVYVAQAGYTPKGNNCNFDVIFVATINSLTSILATLIVFGVLGFRATIKENKCYSNYATKLNTTVDKLKLSLDENTLLHVKNFIGKENLTLSDFPSLNTTTMMLDLTNCTQEKQLDEAIGGPGLAFIAFAEAILSFPLANMWSLIFFLMLVSIGLSTVMGTLTGAIASIRDMGVKTRKELLAIYLTVGLFFSTIVYTTDWGFYFMDVLDNNIGLFTLCPVVLFEVIATSYIYGINRLFQDVKQMTGQQLGPYWKWTLYITSPVLLIIFVVGGLINYFFEVPLTYDSWNKSLVKRIDLAYPTWAYVVVVLICLLSVAAIPVSIFLYKYQIFNLAEYFDKIQRSRSANHNKETYSDEGKVFMDSHSDDKNISESNVL